MKKEIFLIFFFIFIFFSCKKNKPPLPPTISGPDTGFINVPIDFMAQAIDPNKDEVAYQFSWGDGTRNTIGTAFSQVDSQCLKVILIQKLELIV